MGLRRILSVKRNVVIDGNIKVIVVVMMMKKSAVAECLPSRIQNFVDLYFFPLNSAGVYRILTEFFRDF
jgi:hypothetical protein